ncbi:hypothetical protein LEL_04000 [Akanthomyces lecanii RCEF 1005]|uniref:Kinetoplast-associated protein KAP n=1 Tax=Akanthomyces lecanii RCEF 1005 TaxID=1081108 RepID=A0A168H0Z5_CORDF|nr:hypothetical protein LEL_04000 [Akanthomyces lecanii RCEF 1005]
MFPLSPAHDATLNRSPSPRRYEGDYEVRKYTVTSTSEDHIYTKTSVNEDGDTMSSPLVSNTSAVTAATTHSQQENGSSRPASVMNGPSLSPVKDRRHSRVISGTELSPLKILNRKRSSEEASQTDGSNMGPPPTRTARKISSPEKRFPVKIGGGGVDEVRDRQASLDEAMRTNGHLQRPIDIFEDDEEEEAEAPSRPPTAMSNQEDGGFNPDDTMASTFSTFSAVPTLTSYANWRAQQSPAKLAALANVSSSRPSTRDESSNTTNLLMDFTDSLRHPRRSPEKKLLPSSSTMPNLAAATPSRAGATTALIDFDIPPLPTPRSMPSISSRELESLKSGFLSEISSLKASLSGKEAEVQSLKTAVGDAEKRVGESLEKLREESAQREQAVAEKEDWERRGREMETVLHKLRDEIVHGQQEREEVEHKLEESEKRREAAEIMHQEAESKIAGLRAGRETESDPSKPSSPGETSREAELAVERMSRELHGLYKIKHQTKVAALKRSYESRWEKKVKELERRVLDLCEENASLQAGHPNPDDTLLVAAQANAEADKEQASRDRVTIRELNATVQRLEAVVSSVQGDNQHLHGLLEQERVEKGELVQLAEEMMSMQSIVGGKQAPSVVAALPSSSRPMMPEPGHAAGAKTPGKRPLSLQTTTPGRQIIPDGRRGSVGKASGLRAPGSAYRGGATAAAAGSGIGGAAGLRIPGSRSGIMSSIEKMGSHRGRGQ